MRVRVLLTVILIVLAAANLTAGHVLVAAALGVVVVVSLAQITARDRVDRR